MIKDVDDNIIMHPDGTLVKRYDYELLNEKFDKEENDLPLVHTFISN